MTRIRYTGPARGAWHLQRALREEGIETAFRAPMEQRSALQQTVTVALTVGGNVLAAGTYDVIKRVCRRFEQEHPGIKAEPEPGDEDRSEGE